MPEYSRILHRQVADRLAEAIEMRGVAIREFHRQLDVRCKKLGVIGSSYAQVHNYLKGVREPSLAVLRVAAKILNVREAWLVLGLGEPTETRQEFTSLTAARTFSPKETRLELAAYEGIFSAEGWGSSLAGRMPFETLADAVATWTEGAPDRDGLESEQLTQMARDFMTLVQCPLVVWGFRNELSGQEAKNYLLAMLHALVLAMPKPGRGDPVKDYVRVHHRLMEFCMGVEAHDTARKPEAGTRVSKKAKKAGKKKRKRS